MYCMQCFLKSKYIKSRTFNDENRWIIKKVMVLKKLLPHLATRGTYSLGIESAMKRDVSKNWCTLQWCASRGWVIAHENWTSWVPWASYQIRKIAGCACAGYTGNVFPRHRLQRKPLVSDPGMHNGTCVTHAPWCMSGSLTRGGGENVPAFPAHAHPQFYVSGKRPMRKRSNITRYCMHHSNGSGRTLIILWIRTNNPAECWAYIENSFEKMKRVTTAAWCYIHSISNKGGRQKKALHIGDPKHFKHIFFTRKCIWFVSCPIMYPFSLPR